MKNDAMTVVLGGVNLVVQKRDGGTEEVKVRELPVRLLIDKWANLQADEAALVELYCDKETGWDDTLLLESHAEIVEIGDEINSKIFARWTETRRASIARFKSTQESLVGDLTSNTSSTPAASSSAEPTGK